MKLLVAAFSGAIAFSLVNSNAVAATPAELLQSCQVAVKAAAAPQSATVDIPVAGLACWYYMAAIQNMSTVIEQHGNPLLGVCAPSTTSLMQYVRIFVRYAEQHPGEDADNAAALALRALLDAFPCAARRGKL